jgi:hypothetical protein
MSAAVPCSPPRRLRRRTVPQRRTARRTHRRSIALVTVLSMVAALLAFVTGSASAAEVTGTASTTTPTGTLDASFTGDNGSSQNVVGDYQTVAQTFTLSSSGTLTSASAKLSASSNSADLLVQVTELDSARQPGGVLSTATVPAGTVGSSATDIVVTFPSPAEVTAGTSYALQLSTVGSGNYAWHGDSTVQTPANWVKSGTGSWTPAWTTAFAVYVTAAQPSAPAVPDSVQLANNQSQAYYNSKIGKVLNGTEVYFPADGDNVGVGPVFDPAVSEPDAHE